jgi:4-diphosphocytidyl-2C-methyl-D-erythritol kinase
MNTAPAKLNLLLSVGDSLPADHASGHKPGYHLISSWFACIDLHDDIRISTRAKGSCKDDPATWASVSWAQDALQPSAIDWPLEKDLAVRAARLLETHVGKALPTSLAVAKRIPVGGGLGGGSSDAASTLLAMRAAHSLDVSDDTLCELASQLGSDVAFFVRSACDQAPSAIVEGLGELIESAHCPWTSVVLITNNAHCDTRSVYAKYDELRTLRRAELAGEGKKPRAYDDPRSDTVRKRADEMIAANALNERQLMNDLEVAALRTQPLLGPLKTALGKATRRLVHITGSGSSMFIVPEEGKLEWTLERAQRVCASDDGTPISAKACVVRVGTPTDTKNETAD